MAERRTLGAAMSMNPEALAFINGGESQTAAKPVGRPRKSADLTNEVKLTEADGIDSQGDATQTTRGRRPKHRIEASRPTDRDILGEVLVPLTTRLPHRLVQSLRRMCLEQQLRHAKPDSIQEIVEAALEAWLTKQG